MPSTRELIEEIADPGQFEGLATACLREMFPECSLAIQTGVNAEGKTVRSPVDGVASVKIGKKRKLVAIHHTTTAQNKLRGKWLNGITGGKSSGDRGDIAKTGEIFSAEKNQSPELLSVLYLTSNKEPDEKLVREIGKVSDSLGFEIVVVSASTLAHILDTTPSGQWIRKQHLGVEQELLSSELLRKLCAENLEANRPISTAESWIPRNLDDEILKGEQRELTFLVGESGTGKSVACFRHLKENLNQENFSLVITHDVLETSPTIDAAITATLKALHPPLAPLSADFRDFASAMSPLLILIEDANQSSRADQLLAKLVRTLSWKRDEAREESNSGVSVFCPVWPSVVSALSPELQKVVNSLSYAAGRFDSQEGVAAVMQRSKLDDVDLSKSEGSQIAEALGNDPLLIALHDFESEATPENVLQVFVEAELQQAAVEFEGSASDFRVAIHELSEGMLFFRNLRPKWVEVATWGHVSRDSRALLSKIGRRGKLFRLIGASSAERIEFRHDRVRDFLLVSCCHELVDRERLPERLVRDPFFAEIIGSVILERGSLDFLNRVMKSAPLAVVSALRSLRGREGILRSYIVECISDWLLDEETHSREHKSLLLAAEVIIGETIGTEVPRLADLVGGITWGLKLAKICNGSFDGGLEFFLQFDPGHSDSRMAERLLYAMEDHGEYYSGCLVKQFSKSGLPREQKVAALRFAGLVGDPLLIPLISEFWKIDPDSTVNLASYVWALGRCFDPGDTVAIDEVFRGWGALPDAEEKEEERTLTKSHIAYGELNFAFRKFLPERAISYFIRKAREVPELDCCMCQLLHGLDSGEAIIFVAESIGHSLEQLEGTKYWNPTLNMYADDWRRADENGAPMSAETRESLLEVWRDKNQNKYFRIEAFKFWKGSHRAGDIEILRQIPSDSDISDKVFWERLQRGDRGAIPFLIEKLKDSKNFMWWQCADDVCSPELVKFFSEKLSDRAHQLKQARTTTWRDRFFANILMSLKVGEAEALLLENWDGLKLAPHYVLTCLYVATATLVEKAHERIAEHESPREILKYLSTRLGIKYTNRPGLTKRSQAGAILPVSELIEENDLKDLRKNFCENGWFDLAEKLPGESPEKASQRERLWNAFNGLAGEDHRFFLQERIGDIIVTVRSREEFFEILFSWAKDRSDQDALSLLVSILEMKGLRKDLPGLLSFRDCDSEQARTIIKDTIFAVKRASPV